jgi:hypothetical protein
VVEGFGDLSEQFASHFSCAVGGVHDLERAAMNPSAEADT